MGMCYKPAYQEIARAIEAVRYGQQSYQGQPTRYRSPYRKWDRILYKACGGCGKPLGRFENRNQLAFCYECRQILFPDTMTPYHWGNRNRSRDW